MEFTLHTHADSPSTKAKEAKDSTKDKITTKEASKDTSNEKSKDDARGSPTEPPEEVEALADMMDSLVTNNCGETRYIG